MSSSIIRLQSIKLNNFKNIKNGTIDFTSYKEKTYFENKSDIIGIYGQNGSGKTAVIESLKLFKEIISGSKLPKDIKNYIYSLEDESSLKFTFYVEKNDYKYLVYYDFSIRRNSTSFELSREKLSYSRLTSNKPTRKSTIVEYNIDLTDIPLLPRTRYTELVRNNKKNQFNLEVYKRLCIRDKTSFIFSDDLLVVFKNSQNHAEYSDIISDIKYFASANLFVITSEQSAPISLNFIPISFRMENDSKVTSGNIGVKLLGCSSIDKDTYDILLKIISQLNIVLKRLIPNLTLDVVSLGSELSEQGLKLIRIEIVSIRNNIKVPLKYESEGVKKIISILSALISMFNNPSICLAVDEFDAGIFEYLLGELLNIIENRGKGQLLFTSHNLRALEKLNKESLIFSTSNPENRFIRMANIKSNNNLRNIYLRGIDLGGLSESIYEETNSFEIAHAFRKAGVFIE